MELVFFAAALGIIPGAIAHSKGHGFWGWWLFGALLFIVALPLAIIQKPASGPGTAFRQCQFCAEQIKAEAVVCKHCGRDVPQPVV